MKKLGFLVLLVAVVFLCCGAADAFDPSRIRKTSPGVKETVGHKVAAAHELAAQGFYSETVEFPLSLRGKGPWMGVIPSQFTVPQGIFGTVKVYQAELQYFPSTDSPRWNLLAPGSQTESWGGLVFITSGRDDERIVIDLKIDTYVYLVSSMMYYDLRELSNVEFLTGRKLGNMPKENGRYYYEYYSLIIQPGHSITAGNVLGLIGNDKIAGFIICNENGRPAEYVPVKKLKKKHLFSWPQVPIAVYRFSK